MKNIIFILLLIFLSSILPVEAQRSYKIQVCPVSIFGKGKCEFPSISEIIESVLDFILRISPVVLVILIVIGGIYYLLVSFNEEFIKKGHEYISHAIRGYIILLLISLIFSIIYALLGGPSQGNPQ